MADLRRQSYQACVDTLHRLALAAEFRDPETGAHIQRVGAFAGLLAHHLRLPPGEIELVRLASPLHDVGKIGIPEDILLKPGRLTPEERSHMEQHTLIGGTLLGGSAAGVLKAAGAIAASHHERWDGSGYPHGLSGEAIPLFGRICAVADVFDALTTVRPYKPAFTNEEHGSTCTHTVAVILTQPLWICSHGCARTWTRFRPDTEARKARRWSDIAGG